MCLTIVDSKPTSVHESKIGYKAMTQRSDGTLTFAYYGEGKVMEVGKTYTDRKRKPIEERYPAGYHIYVSKERSAEFCIGLGYKHVKVKFDKVVATGYQYKDRVIVAKKITLLEVM